MPSDGEGEEVTVVELPQELATARIMLADDAEPMDRLELSDTAFVVRQHFDDPIWGLFADIDGEPIAINFLDASEFASTEALLAHISRSTQSFSEGRQ